MSFEENTTTYENIINCEVKDTTGLHDYQKLPQKGAAAIPRVGIERFRIPLMVMTDENQLRTHDAHASMFVYLAQGKTGVNMSRFCQILQDEAQKHGVGSGLIQNTLERFRRDLRDYDHEELIPEAQLKIKLQYPMKQKSLKSDNWGWQYYDTEWDATIYKSGQIITTLKIGYEYSSTCPCSLSMAKQYERAYEAGVETEGNGIATAHSQRSLATVSLSFKNEDLISVESLVEELREAIPTETQSLVKRLDEQAFAILNGENPMFVEHVSRRLSKAFDDRSDIIDWNAKIEHFESLHSHNAVAYISKAKS